MSEREQTLQTLLTAARGEITALTEANKLLAAQVAGPVVASVGDDTQFQARLADLYAAYDESVEIGISAPNDRAVAKFVAYLDSRTAKVSTRAADAPSEPSDSATPPAGLDTREQMIWLMGRNSFEGSATATRLDILSLVHSLMHNAYTAGMEGEEIDTSYAAKIENGLRAMESRAADALDSQPTEAVALLCEVEGMQNR